MFRRWLHRIGSGNTVRRAEDREHFLRSWGITARYPDPGPRPPR